MAKKITPIQFEGKKYFIEDSRAQGKKRDGIFNREDGDKIYEDTDANGKYTKYDEMDPGAFDREVFSLDDKISVALFSGAKIDKLQEFFSAVSALQANPLHILEQANKFSGQLATLDAARIAANIGAEVFKSDFNPVIVPQIDKAFMVFKQRKGNLHEETKAFINDMKGQNESIGFDVDWPQTTNRDTYYDYTNDDRYVTADGAFFVVPLALNKTKIVILNALDQSAESLQTQISSDYHDIESSDERIAMVGNGMRIDVSLEVSAEGKVTQVNLGDVPDAVPQSFRDAMVKRFENLELPATGEEVVINYPVSFGVTSGYESMLNSHLQTRLRLVKERIKLRDDDLTLYPIKVEVTVNSDGKALHCDAEAKPPARSSEANLEIQKELTGANLPKPPAHLVREGVARIELEIYVFKVEGQLGLRLEKIEAEEPHAIHVH
jgi:hypothetical protein